MSPRPRTCREASIVGADGEEVQELDADPAVSVSRLWPKADQGASFVTAKVFDKPTIVSFRLVEFSAGPPGLFFFTPGEEG
jgi:hypothetical protein